MEEIAKMLLEGNHSLVVANSGGITAFDGRGVSDLYRLLHDEPKMLRGASVADKVVGKAAASLMVMASVSSVYAYVLSQSALDLLQKSGIMVEYHDIVPFIINRAGTGMCPLEDRCQRCATPEESLEQIWLFISEMKNKKR